MKRSFFYYLFFCVIALSCSKEDSNQVVPLSNDGRLIFENSEDFHKTFLELSKMSSKDELYLWAQSKNHNSLLYSEESSLEKYPDALRVILNKDFECEVGDSIIWFKDGNFYAFPKHSQNLNELKRNFTTEFIIWSINSKVVSDSELSGDNSLKSLPSGFKLRMNSISAPHQHEFNQQWYQPCGATQREKNVGKRKYVHEIVDVTFASYPGPVYTSYLYLKVKLEWKGTRWRPASEKRNISISVSGNAIRYPGGSGNDFAIPYKTFECSGDQVFLLSSVVGATPIAPYWIVSMEGSITQQILGDNPANKWTSSGRLW